MGLGIDRGFLALASAARPSREGFQKPALHDIEGRRKLHSIIKPAVPPAAPEGVIHNIIHIATPDGYQLPVYHYKRSDGESSSPSAAVIHAHGGGFFALSADLFIERMSKIELDAGVQVFSVDFRLAPEHPYPTPLEDCWAVLTWFQSNVQDLGVDKARIAVMGESSGGGLAAGLTLLARDRGLSPTIAKQLLLYPMLDDRNVDKPPGPIALWDDQDNITGWAAYLGSCGPPSRDGVPDFAAPARVSDVTGLPPLYMETTQLDLFAKEDADYARKFLEAGIETEFYLHPGLPHGFDQVVPTHSISRRLLENTGRVLRNL